MNMKRLIPFILAICCLTSCTGGGLHVETEPDVAAGLNKFGDKTVHLDYAPETAYHLDATDMPEDFSSDAVTLRNGRLYLRVPMKFNNSNSTADFTPAYVELETGILKYFCPDPLCTHDDDSLCEFKRMEFPVNDTDDILFASRIKESSASLLWQVVKIDLMTADIEVIHSCSPLDDDPEDSVYIDRLEGDILYYFAIVNVQSQETREEIRYYQQYQYHIPTGTVSKDGEWVTERENRIAQTVMPAVLSEHFADVEPEDWFETQRYVYFTKYEPTVMGTFSGRGSTSQIEYSHSGKIYRIPKTGGEEELIFDGGTDEIYVDQWFVIGDHLYLMLRELNWVGGECHWRGMPGSMGIIRVNMTDHTMKYLTSPQ